MIYSNPTIKVCLNGSIMPPFDKLRVTSSDVILSLSKDDKLPTYCKKNLIINIENEKNCR